MNDITSNQSEIRRKSALPTRRQIEFKQMEKGVFIHFGIRTFYNDVEDFSENIMLAEMFNPTALDCNQWVTTAKNAGFKYMIMTAKHHDGFCLWPSKYTGFSVASSPWKGGKGDVVREFTDACHSNGIKAGVYYSPYDQANPMYNDPVEYDDYFINQLSELLTNYGDISIIWFDGCGSHGHKYDWPRITAEVRRMQPGILIFHLGDPDYRWVGNEEGLTPFPFWNTVDDQALQATDLCRDVLGKWVPAECDCRMRYKRWFFSEYDEHTVKTLEQLMGLYHYSVGRGSNLLLNIGPDRRGLLPEKDKERLLEFGDEIRKCFSSSIATLIDFKNSGNEWTFTRDEQMTLDHVVIQEDIEFGEQIRKYKIEVGLQDYLGSFRWIKVFEGESVGHKAICSFPPVPAWEVRVVFLDTEEQVHIKNIEVHYVAGLK